jgi:hypothetical protein
LNFNKPTKEKSIYRLKESDKPLLRHKLLLMPPRLSRLLKRRSLLFFKSSKQLLLLNQVKIQKCKQNFKMKPLKMLSNSERLTEEL